MSQPYLIPRDAVGEVVFIIAGGPSVAGQNAGRLKGRKVMAINSSAFTFPWVPMVFSMDGRWLREFKATLRAHPFEVVSCSTGADWPELRMLRRLEPPHFSSNPGAVACLQTSLTGALNLAALRGPRAIVILGADGKRGSDGRTHHHVAYRWPHKEGSWNRHKAELAHTMKPLQALGIEVLNASPGSAWGDLWPVMSLTEALQRLDGAAGAP